MECKEIIQGRIPNGGFEGTVEIYVRFSGSAGGQIHKLINSVWNKEELPDQRKKSLIVPIHKKGDKTGCNNYRGISLLSTLYKI
jgi:hypothetical protein